jgi:hypothetical protein
MWLILQIGCIRIIRRSLAKMFRKPLFQAVRQIADALVPGFFNDGSDFAIERVSLGK